jgi:hypothetical protein
MRAMRLLLPLLLCATLTLAVACGGDDDDNGAPTFAPNATPTTDVIEWMRATCERDSSFLSNQSAIPGYEQDTSQLPIEQRRERVETVWPAQLALYDAYLDSVDAVTPPERVDEIHAAIRARIESMRSEVQRSLDDIDEIFASQDSLQTNNARLMAAEQTGNDRVNALFDEQPALSDAFFSLPECQ